MRLEKKKVLQRIQQNKKRMNLYRALYRLMLERDALKEEEYISSGKWVDALWNARKKLVAALARKKETYVDPAVFERRPLQDEPLFATPEQIDMARKENVPLIEKLIEAAIENDDMKLVEQLVFRNFPGKGHSRLEIAFRRGYLGAAQYFVDKGDDINERNPSGQTLFHLLGKQIKAFHNNGHWDDDHKKFEFLLRNYANPQLLDNAQKPPVFYAGEFGVVFAEHATLILRELSAEREIKIRRAFQERDIQALEDIVYAGLHHSARVDKPRFVAALEQGYDDIAEFFAFQGDNVDVRNENGETLLYAAAAELNYPRVCMLLRLNADPNAVTNDCSTPLMIVGFNRSENIELRRAIIQELLEYGADANIIDCQWNTAYHYAEKGGICMRDEVEKIKQSIPFKPYHMVLNKVYDLTRS